MTTLHMTQITLDARRTFDWAHTHGFSRDQDYTVHSATRSAFGALAPQPWAVRPSNNGRITVLGYSSANRDDLHAVMANSDVHIRAAVREVSTKPMPVIPSNTSLAFEVRVNPVARRYDKDGKRHEVDVAFGRPDRAIAYQEWLAERLSGAAVIHACTLTRFQLVRVHRHAVDRPIQRCPGWHTDATMNGVLEVIDQELFHDKLAHGIGRHKAFGFGALLIRAVH
jgi:CRISPR system Cascade subunit CasE